MIGNQRRSTWRPALERLEDRTVPSILGVSNLLTTQHADIGVHFEDGKLEMAIHNEAVDQEFAPNQAIFVALPGAKQVRPDGVEFDFTGADAGSNIWVIDNLPETNPGVLIGFSAEEIDPGTFATYEETDPRRPGETAEFVTITLKAVRGPGHFSVWDFHLGNPRVWMSTALGGVTNFDKVIIPAGSHNDMNFGFTKPGRYQIDLQASAFLDDGSMTPIRSAVFTFSFSIQEPLIVTGSGAGVPGRVQVVAARGGPVLFQAQPFGPAFKGGVRVATGDVNNDGVLDIVVASGPGIATRVAVFNGLTGKRMALPNGFLPYGAAYKQGAFVAVGDVVPGGFREIIVGPSKGKLGVRVFQVNGTAVAMPPIFAYGPNFAAGIRVAAANLDGNPGDEIITAPGAGLPRVRVFDGTGAALNALGFQAYPTAGGISLAVGDVNGDGIPDILTGRDAGGTVKVFNGDAPGAVLANFVPYPGTARGARVAAVEVNGDDRLDLVLAPTRATPALIRVLNSPRPLITDPRMPLAAFRPRPPIAVEGLFVAAGTFI